MSRVKKRRAGAGVKCSGLFVGRVVEYERMPDGSPVRDDRGQIVVTRVVEDNIPIPNGATTAGLNHALDTVFRGGTPITAWYTGVINNASYTTGPSSADTASSHAGWVEWTGYDESVRQTWSPAAASGGSVSNSTVMTFTNNTGSSVTIRGVFIQSTSAKSSTSGTLWASAVEPSGRTLADGQAFQVIYVVTLTPSS